jgi:hypothetical protein
VDPPAAVSTTALHSKASASIVMFNDVEHPANGTSSSLDKLPWQMRTVEFVRRLASVSVSDAVSFVDNLMKICEACTAVVYSLCTDTHDLPSTHSPVLDDDADAVELLLLFPSLTWLSRQFSSSSLVANKRAASIDVTHVLHLLSTYLG